MASAPGRPASEADFTFQVGSMGTDVLKVTGFTGAEEIGRLFHFRVTFCSDEPDISFDDVVGKPCTLEIRTAGGTRYINGIVRRFERSGEGSSLTYYAADVVPVHWLLTKRHKSRIFQENNCSDMTIPGVIKKVFDDAGIPSDNYRFALHGTYDTREYVVQYRESEMNFVSRLMEEEGIFFFFEHTAERHVMVIGDSPAAHADTPDTTEFAFRDPTGMVTDQEQEFIHGFRDGEGIETGAVTLDDYNFKQPKVNLAAGAEAEHYTSLEYSDYPGRYVERSVGDRYATIRLEEFQCQRRVQYLKANVRALLPGYKFTLIEHPNEALNREYLVTRIEHRGHQPQSGQEEADAERGIEYSAEVRTIPADVPFRTPRTTPLPRIHGSQTAVVVGPSGEEIYTDEYGRVKVQYYWDREGQYDENSSRWTRVSQGSAGGQYGIMFLPRVGQEVVIEYLEGDPNRPIITGRVYNNDQMPPYTLPDEKTKSCIKTNSSKGGGGTNEIRFEDKKDEEQIMIFAQKDLHLRAENDEVETVGANQSLGVGANQYVKIGDSKHLEVVTDVVEKVGGNVKTEISGNKFLKVSGNFNDETSGNRGLKATGTIVIESSTGITLKCGSNFVVVDNAGVSINGTMLNLNSGGAAGALSPIVISKSVKSPATADKGVPGQDVTYQQQPDEYAQVETDEVEQQTDEREAEQEQSWIEIELVDDDGQPVPHERYEVVLPNGNKIYGNLDQNGLARVTGIQPGECEINFPRLDKEGWRR